MDATDDRTDGSGSGHWPALHPRPLTTPLRLARPRPTTPTTTTTTTTAASRRVFQTLRRMQLTGSTALTTSPPVPDEATSSTWTRHGARSRLQTVADLPRAFVRDRSDDDAREYERRVTFNGTKRSFVLLIREIYDLLDTTASTPVMDTNNKKALRRLLHEIVQRVLEPNVLHGGGGGSGGLSDAVMDAVAAEREKFLCLGGAECLLSVMHAIRVEDHAPPAPEQHMSGRGATAEVAAASAAALGDQHTVRHRRNVHDRYDVRALWATPSPVRIDDVTKTRSDSSSRNIMNDAMGILRELCYFSITLARELCDKDGLVVYLFQLMEVNKYFDNAAGFVEEILAVREDSFDLSHIPRFHEIVKSFSSRQLAFFCRVLALVVFEPEDRRLLETSKVIKSMELLKLRRNRLLRADNVVDRNHAIIYNSPTIMTRLLTVLKLQNFYFSVNPVYEPFTNDLATSAEFAMLLSHMADRSDWDSVERLLSSPLLSADGEMTVLRRARLGDDPDDTEDHAHDHRHDHDHHNHFPLESAVLRDLIFRRAEPGQPREREDVEAHVIMKSIILAPYRVEVLFVLCTLLNGKRKIDFQDRLAAMGLVTSLNMMFDKFDWHTTSPPSSQTPLHGPGCGCSLDASLKIQFLRLIHNFCDRDYSDNTSKLMLLSPYELELLKRPDMDPIDLNHSDKGLLCKIIRTLIDQPADSIYRFWLSSCVEAFLRRAAPNEQLFVARTPLLKSLVDEILSGGAYRAQGSFQSAFDLLGEMTKGNWQTLQLFHRLLDDIEFGNFMEVVIRNLVDSNVFVRSMLLSGEKFAKQPGMGTFGIADDFEMDRMSEFLTVNVTRLLKDLMTIVTLDDVNHENICCLNTAIVILIFQHRRNRLPIILGALREHEELSGKSGYVCSNFRSLLWFWIQYYTPRGRDRLSLEHSSDVKFEEWRDVVAMLCADDGSATALLENPMKLPASPYSRLYATLVPRRHT